MRGPVIVAVAVAIAGAIFVLVSRPSPGEAWIHDWLAVAFVALTAGIFWAGGTGPRRRLALVGVAYALFVFTTLAWFVESALLWAVLALAVSAAALLVRRWSRPSPGSSATTSRPQIRRRA